MLINSLQTMDRVNQSLHVHSLLGLLILLYLRKKSGSWCKWLLFLDWQEIQEIEVEIINWDIKVESIFKYQPC